MLFFKLLIFSSVMSSDPGAISCSGAHKSARTLTPMYGSKERSLETLSVSRKEYSCLSSRF